MRLRSFVVAASMLGASLAARADTYNYTFAFSGSNVITTVSFNESSILTTTTIVQPTSFVSSSTTNFSPIVSLGIDPLFAEDCTGPPDSCVVVNYQAGPPSGAFFPNTNLTSVGVYTDTDGEVATLTITDLSVPTSVTPEPSSFALLGTGLLVVAGAVRKRFA